MRVRPLVIGLATLLVSSFIFMGTINVQAAEVKQAKPVTDTVEANVPDTFVERHGIPDVIYTKDGVYEKQQLSISNYNEDEVVYDVTKTAADTEIIVAYDGTYLKVSESTF